MLARKNWSRLTAPHFDDAQCALSLSKGAATRSASDSSCVGCLRAANRFP
jgi:hypothetical protein